MIGRWELERCKGEKDCEKSSTGHEENGQHDAGRGDSNKMQDYPGEEQLNESLWY
jgi:hypothetical protein